MSEHHNDPANSATSSSYTSGQTESFKTNARDEALSAAEKGLQAAREALEAAERKLAEAQRQAAYDRAQQAQASNEDPISVDFEDMGSAHTAAQQQTQNTHASSNTEPAGVNANGSHSAAQAAEGSTSGEFGTNPHTKSSAQQTYTPPQNGQPYTPPHAQPYTSQSSGSSQYYQQPPVQPHYSAPYAASKDHVAAGLLAIFLGCWGVHKFYLGYSTQGFIMLAVSVLGGILSLGLIAAIVWIVAIIEGIIYLSKSQSEFEQLYVYGKHEWF